MGLHALFLEIFSYLQQSPAPCRERVPWPILSLLGKSPFPQKHLLLKIKGVTLYPKTLENAVLGISDVLNYQVEAYTGEDDHSDHIILRVGSYRNDKEFKILLKRRVKAKARVTPDIVIESPEDVQKRLFEGGSRKPIIFKDSRRNIYE